MIYEPTLDVKEYLGHPVMCSLQKFKSASDLIIVNRMVPMFSDVMEKIYTRDLFGINWSGDKNINGLKGLTN